MTDYLGVFVCGLETLWAVGTGIAASLAAKRFARVRLRSCMSSSTADRGTLSTARNSLSMRSAASGRSHRAASSGEIEIVLGCDFINAHFQY